MSIVEKFKAEALPEVPRLEIQVFDILLENGLGGKISASGSGVKLNGIPVTVKDGNIVPVEFNLENALNVVKVFDDGQILEYSITHNYLNLKKIPKDSIVKASDGSY